MILSLCILAAVNHAAPEFAPTVVEVDLSAFFSIKSEISQGEQEREHDQIYPSVVRVLHAAGVPIAAPPSENERELLEIAGVPAVDVEPPQRPQKLRLEFSSPDFMKSIYRIHVSVQRPDGSYESIPALSCGPDCLAENVEPFLREHQAPILALLETPEPAAPASSPPPPTSVSTAHPPDALSPAPAGKARPLGPVGIAGTVLAGVGLGGVVWGSVALGLDRTRDWERGFDERMVRDRYFNTGTGVALGVGAGLLATGVTMFLVDLFVLKKRNHRRPSALRLAPLQISF